MDSPGYLTIRGALAEKIMNSVEVGKKAVFTVKGKVTEISQRDSLEYCCGPMDSEKSKKRKAMQEYTVCVDITDANIGS